MAIRGSEGEAENHAENILCSIGRFLDGHVLTDGLPSLDDVTVDGEEGG